APVNVARRDMSRIARLWRRARFRLSRWRGRVESAAYRCKRGDEMELATKKAGFSAKRLERITEHLDRNYIQPGKIAGCQTLVARHGHVAYCRSQGSMDLERGKEMRDDTIFRIYSMTKPITSAALMTIYEQGYFQLNDPVSRVIPEWRD